MPLQRILLCLGQICGQIVILQTKVVYPNAPLTLLAVQYLVKKCLILEQKERIFFLPKPLFVFLQPDCQKCPLSAKNIFVKTFQSKVFFQLLYFFSSHSISVAPLLILDCLLMSSSGSVSGCRHKEENFCNFNSLHFPQRMDATPTHRRWQGLGVFFLG